MAEAVAGTVRDREHVNCTRGHRRVTDNYSCETGTGRSLFIPAVDEQLMPGVRPFGRDTQNFVLFSTRKLFMRYALIKTHFACLCFL